MQFSILIICFEISAINAGGKRVCEPLIYTILTGTDVILSALGAAIKETMTKETVISLIIIINLFISWQIISQI